MPIETSLMSPALAGELFTTGTTGEAHMYVLSHFSRVWLFYNSMDCSPPGFLVHGILHERIQVSVVMPSSKGSSRPRDRTCVSYICLPINSCLFTDLSYFLILDCYLLFLFSNFLREKVRFVFNCVLFPSLCKNLWV